jgi:predicted outer membrane repeat protein
MRATRAAAWLVAAAAGAAAASCGGGGGGGGGGPSGPNATWVTDATVYDAPAVAPVDTSTPAHVVSGNEAAMIAGLQAALNDTAGGVIVFNTSVNVTLHLTQQFYIPYLSAPRAVVIDGGNKVTLDGQSLTRILQKGYRIDLTVQNMKFANGRVGHVAGTESETLSPESGAGINVEDWDGRLTVIHCTFDNCQCTEVGPDRGGGAIRAAGQRHVLIADCTFTNCRGSNGGAVNTLGSQLTVVDCIFTNNAAHGYGGGFDARPAADGMGGIGGAIYTDGVSQNADAPRSVLSRCTFTGNTAGDHAGAVFNYTIPGTGSVSIVSRCTFENNSVPDSATLYVGTSGALYTQGADTSVVDSTFSGNFAQKGGGAISFHTDRPSRVANCTFSGNSVWYDEGNLPGIPPAGYWGGAIAEYGAPLYISHCTFADNRAGIGAAIRNDVNSWLKSCVFSNNLGTLQWEGHAVRITAHDGGGNVQWPATKNLWGTAEVPATATVVFANPNLDVLNNNGGPTRTRLPASGGPAVDAGSESGYPPTDQRGQPRPLGVRPDAGSVELE